MIEQHILAAVLALNTTMRGCEIKGLQWQDIDFVNSTLTIRKSKTAAGRRVIPLNDGAFETLVALRQLAETFGMVEDSHYCFASFKRVGEFDGNEIVGCRMHNYNPLQHIGSWKKAWRALTTKAKLKGLRFHDLRHKALTELYEDPNTSEQTIRSLAGHVSPHMAAIYSHTRLDAKRKAIGALSTKTSPKPTRWQGEQPAIAAAVKS